MGSEAVATSAEIARLANIDRAVVSNWRRRYEDFPQPVGGTTASPLFSLDQIENWLRVNKPKVRLSAEGRVWQELKTLGDDLRLSQVLTATGLFLRHIKVGEWPRLAALPDEALETAVARKIRRSAEGRAGFPESLPSGTASLLRAVAELAEVEGEARLFEFFATRFLEAHQRSFAASPTALATLMVSLVGKDSRTVLDPACGTGTLLVAANSPGRQLLGQELDSDLAQLAAVRLALITDQRRVLPGDALRADAFSGELVDAVVCNPPFNERDWGHDELAADSRWEYGLPPRMESELAWVQHALAHVKPGGRVIVLMPVTAASRRSGRRIRAELIRRGALRAVIGVPSSMASTAGIPAHLWLLRRPAPSSRIDPTVLFSEVGSEAEIESIVAMWERYQRDPDASQPDGCVVPLLDLLDDETDVTPTRHLVSTVVKPSDLLSLVAEIEEQLRQVHELLPTNFGALPSRTAFSLTTIADLANVGALTVGRPGKAEEIWGEPGDLVVSLGGERLDVQVLDQRASIASPQQLIKVNRQVADPHFLAGFLRSVHNHSPAGGSSTGVRRDLRRAVSARLPTLADQRVYGTLFQRAEELRASLHTVAAKGETLARMMVDGLVEGHLPDSGRRGTSEM